MRIARLLIYEGTAAGLAAHFERAWVKPGDTAPSAHLDRGTRPMLVTVSEPAAAEAGGRVELQDGEIAVIKVVK